MTRKELGIAQITGDEAAAWVCTRLERAGLRVYRSFDLRSASDAWAGCTCPGHDTETCDCQLIVLLAYHEQDEPVTLVMHSHLGWTGILLTGAMGGETAAIVATTLEEGYSTLGQTSLLAQRQGGQLQQGSL